jgi:Mg-chelatase subunit ChlD
MSSLVNALDNFTPTQIGKNAHKEYGWSNSIREKVLQFSFQVTRTDVHGLNNLRDILRDMLGTLKLKQDSTSDEESNAYLKMLYKMIGQTRDIIDGKGEYALTYMMIYTWYEFYPELSFFSLKCLVDLGDKTVHPYGSWKDIKYFCRYVKTQTHDENHPLIQIAISIINAQLRKDMNYLVYEDVSLAAKWVAREGSSFYWLYTPLAADYFSEYMITAKTSVSQATALLKCKTRYRKMLSKLNKIIDTVQIKQCDGKWADICFSRVTSISLAKQKKAFMNIKQNGAARHADSPDRIECAQNFKSHIQRAIKGEIEMKGKRVGMVDFTKQALALVCYDLTTPEHQLQIDLLNSQWRDNSTQTGALGNFIAMVDVSGSMEGDPLHAANALGIRIAEKSKLGKRVMTFGANPRWINLEQCDGFVSMTSKICTDSGLNTNFYAALDLILDAIIQSNLSPEDVQDMVLVILSDMQLDQADKNSEQTMYDSIKLKYEAAGMRLYGRPFKPPHILLWNLRSTSGFPTMSTQPNASMMSGFSPALLNLFCAQGVDALESCTPWSILTQSLENERYKILGDKLSEMV